MTAFVEGTTFGDLVLRAAQRHGDRTAVVFPGRSETFRELADASVEVARGLIALGVEPGDHVGIFMPNSFEMIHALFGAALAGAVVCPVNARYKAAELRYVIENADHRVLLTSNLVDEHVDFPGLIQDAFAGLAASDPERLSLAEAPELRQVVLMGTRDAPGMLAHARFAELAATVSPEAVDERRACVRLRDEGIILYTSGTTANPKGCVITHEAIVRSALGVAAREELTASDVVWDPLPLFHTSGLQPMMYCLDIGALFVCMTHFEPDAALAQIREHRPTVIKAIFMPVMAAIVNHPDFPLADHDAIRIAAVIGPPDTVRLVYDAFPNAVIEGAYGLAECGGYVSTNAMDESEEQQLYTIGPPYPGILIRAMDTETGAFLPPGVPGELVVKGFTNMERYHKDPERTAEVLPPDGWLRTGDRGVIREDRRIEFIGRMKEMIRVGGENVGPQEIEGYLSTHPAVHLVQAVGIPDARLDEVAAAFVELKPGASATEEELIAYCRGQIANFKVPRYVRFVDEWPMSATKIQKFRLRELIAEELAASKARA